MKGIFHRVSVRKYLDKPIEEEKIELMLRAAMAAPSAQNQQPWEYYVVRNKEKIAELATSTPYTGFAKGAPVIFVPCYRFDGPSPDYFEIDMSASVENLLIEADELELGACWMGIAPNESRMETVRNMIGVPEGLKPFALIACGYPQKEKLQTDRFEAARVHYID